MNETEQSHTAIAREQLDQPTTVDSSLLPYRQQLALHRATIERIAGQYRAGQRISWTKAFAAEPELVPLLLLGSGTAKDKLNRLKSTYQEWHRSDTKETRQRLTFQGHPSKCSVFDDHYDELMRLADAYRRPNGKVWWSDVVKENPAVARKIGVKGDKNSLTLLTFWYRSRLGTEARFGRRAIVARRDNQQSTTPAMLQAQPQVPQVQHPRRNGNTPPSATIVRFCSHCGHPVGLDVLASDVVRSMTTAGLTQDQIVSTLTRAAAAITKMTASATTEQDTTT